MTTDNVQSELEKRPFIPFRLHLTSGQTIDVLSQGSAFMLRRAVMVLQDPSRRGPDAGYNVVSVQNIEMLEQLVIGSARRQRGG
jgi:hypothetical protein